MEENNAYRSILLALVKTLTRNAGTVHNNYSESERYAAKLSLAEWARGLHQGEYGDDIRERVNHLLALNRVADDLDSLIRWYDDIPSQD